MKVSAFNLDHAKALHFLLDEAHVGRAAVHLGITAAAASNALRRLREELGDPLLVKKGRGLVRTRTGEDLRPAARDVVLSAERLLRVARPFDPAAFRGDLPIAMAEHVAAILLPRLDALVRARAPHATLAIAPIPTTATDWLERSGGVLVTPRGAFASVGPNEALDAESLYEDRYVCVMRRGHPSTSLRWTAKAYAEQAHVLVTPRGVSARSDVDEQLFARGLSRRIARVVPSFTLAVLLVAQSDLVLTIPERCTPPMALSELMTRDVPLRLRPLSMSMVVHHSRSNDALVAFIKGLLRHASSRPRRGGVAARLRVP